ncbi:MAG: NblA/ycf18 family protein [Synechococcales bacterium]|nr:NblA/ycf18 family protein [Synechococcales bacterium]
MNQGQKLSLEQEFNLRAFAGQVQQMSREQAQEFLIALRKQMMVRDNIYRDLVKESWGIQ